MKLISILALSFYAIAVNQGTAEEAVAPPELYLSCVKTEVRVDEKIVLIETLEPGDLAERKLRLHFVSREVFEASEDGEEADDLGDNQDVVPALEGQAAQHFSHGTPLPPAEPSFRASRITHLSFSEPGEYLIKVEWRVEAGDEDVKIESNMLKVIVRKAEKKANKDAASGA